MHASPPKRFRMLIVDDEDMIVRIIARVMNKRLPEIDVSIALDGESALNMMQHQGYDFILTDLMMPRMNGYELIRRVHQYHPDIWCATMSGYVMASDALPSEYSGLQIQFHMQKPFEMEYLIQEIASIVQRRNVFSTTTEKEIADGAQQTAIGPTKGMNDTKSKPEKTQNPENQPYAAPAKAGSRSELALYPYIMGGLLHNALNTMMSLRYRASQLSESATGAAADISAIDKGTEQLEQVLKLMQTISRKYYAAHESGLSENQIDAMVKTFAGLHPEVRCTFQADLPSTISSLPAGVVEFILGELLKNAASACAGIAHPEITLVISFDRKTNILSFECLDNGTGFSDEMLRQIHDQRLKPGRHQPGKGYGLYLIYELVSRLRGALLASNIAPKGSRVQVLMTLKAE